MIAGLTVRFGGNAESFGVVGYKMVRLSRSYKLSDRLRKVRFFVVKGITLNGVPSVISKKVIH